MTTRKLFTHDEARLHGKRTVLKQAQILRKKWEKYIDDFDLLDEDAVLTLEESKMYMQNHIKRQVQKMREKSIRKTRDNFVTV